MIYYIKDEERNTEREKERKIEKMKTVYLLFVK